MSSTVSEGPPFRNVERTTMTSAKSTRSDAVNNRERILAVAREAFGTSSGASLTAIAKQAGVGIGTLYRHFPNREALIVALYRHQIQEIIDLAPKLAATRPPLTALREWLAEVAHYGQLKYGAAEVIHAATTDAEYYQPFVDAIGQLLDAGAAAGTLKPEVEPEDVLMLLGVLWQIDPGRPGTGERVERILELIVDALRAR